MKISMIVLSVLVFLLAVSLLSLYENIPFENKVRVFVPVNKSSILEQKSYTSGMQFYPDMRFNHLPITYFIDPSCSETNKRNMQNATELLKEKTNVSFSEVNGESDIIVGCSERYMREESIFVAGEGGPVSIINTSLYYVIQEGSIKLYSSEKCGYNIELHELLHVLGFDHSPNINSVMYNITGCDQYITHDIVNELARLYSQKPLPDLYFQEVNATRAGRYLNIRVEVRNRGLVDAENVSLSLFNSEELEEFDLGQVKFGAGKTMTVENIRVGNINSLKVIIDADNKIEEITKQNNVVEMAILEE